MGKDLDLFEPHNDQVNLADPFDPNYKYTKGATPRLIGSG